MNNQLQNWYIKCDESTEKPYMVIGGIWCPTQKYQEVLDALQEMRINYKVQGEMKFKKIRNHNVPRYKALIDEFFNFNELQFRSIVVPLKGLDLDTFHEGDNEVAFYKFYYLMLVKKIECGNTYIIHPDHRTNRQTERLGTLKDYLNQAFHTCTIPPVKHIEPRDSKHDNLIQMVDILIGAIQWNWNKNGTSEAKGEITRYLLSRLNFRTFVAESRYWKFQIFPLRLQTQQKITAQPNTGLGSYISTVYPQRS